MIQEFQSLLTTPLGAALVTGTIIFVGQKLYDKSFLEPVIQYNQNLGKLRAKLLFYTRYIANPVVREKSSEKELTEYEKCSDELRTVWSEIEASYMVLNRLLLFRIPHLGKVLKYILKIPNIEDFDTSMRNLIGISNGLFASSWESCSLQREWNTKALQKIYEIMQIN